MKCSQKFSFCGKIASLCSRTRASAKGEIFQKVLVRFQQKRSQMKAYYYCFFSWKKKSIFFSKKLIFTKKCFFFMSIFFENFCFLPTYMFDFNKWRLEWKLITTASYFRENNQTFFSKTWNFSKKCVFWRQIFLKIFVSCQYICSIWTNEVSNESLLL